MDENAVITSRIGRLRTSGHVEIVDGMQGVTGSNPLASTDRKSLVCMAFGVNEIAIGNRF